MTNKENQYYDFDYWFNNKDEHKEEDNFDSGYYVYKLYNHVIRSLKNDIPKDGYIVVFGTNRCVSFQLLCDIFGEDRCVGFDMFNPTNHPKVIIKDCMTLSDSDNLPIAFFHNDIGSFPTTPELKKYVQEWAAKNVVKNGYALSRNNLNRAKYDIEGVMTNLGFLNTNLEHVLKNINTIENQNNLFDHKTIEGHMISVRKNGV